MSGAQGAGDELQVGIGCGYFAQHLFVAGDGQFAKVFAHAFDIHAKHGGKIFFVAQQEIDLAHQFAVDFLRLGFAAD